MEPVLYREAYNGQWLNGYEYGFGIHLGQIHNSDEPYSAAIISVGIPLFGLGGLLNPLLKNIKWASQLSNWKSLEVFIGYRFLGHTDAVYAYVYGVGGRVYKEVDLKAGL